MVASYHVGDAWDTTITAISVRTLLHAQCGLATSTHIDKCKAAGLFNKIPTDVR